MKQLNAIHIVVKYSKDKLIIFGKFNSKHKSSKKLHKKNDTYLIN